MSLSQALQELLSFNKSGDVSQELRSRLFGPLFSAIALLAAFGVVFSGGLWNASPIARGAQLFILAMLALVWLIWKRGWINWAAYILISGLWGLGTLAVISTGDQANHWLIPQFMLAILAHFILNRRAAISLAVMTVAGDLIIYQFALYQYFPAGLRELTFGNDWVAIIISSFFLLFIFYLADFVLRESLRQAKLTEDRYHSLFEKTNDAVFLVDREYRILHLNQQAADLLGYRIDELIGKPYSNYVAPEEKQKVQENFEHLNKEGTAPFFERILVRKDGSRCHVEFNAAAVKDEQANLLYYQGVARDLTERKRLEEQLRYSLEEMETLAMQDPLTGLLNRRAITKHAEAEWHRSARERKPMCVVLIDLDNLKDVNDTSGHQVGDQAIIELAAVIRLSRRRYDWAGRWGGDEFMLVLPGANLVEAREAAERLRTQYAESQVVQGGMPGSVSPRVSVGVACYSGRPGEEIPLTQLIAQADQALYRAKGLGKNRVELYRDEK
ncbi:MAG: diguanylate cyclase [Chloroflexi bacterium]|nr:diguanylate cyclase [Chloroflexota bacterium]